MAGFLVLALLALLGHSCTPEPAGNSTPDTFRNGVLVLNEGVWTQNNATLDWYAAADGWRHFADVFAAVNGQPLGDVANAMAQDGDTLYVVMNNSLRVYKLQLPSLKLLGTLQLPSGASPRQLAFANRRQAWITSLLDGTIYLANLETMTLTGTLPIENYAEGVALAAGRAFVACGNYAYPAANNKLAVFGTASPALQQYLTLDVENPGPVLTTPQGWVAVGSRGGVLQDTGCVYRLNPQTLAIEARYPMPCKLHDLTWTSWGLLALTDSTLSLLDTGTGSWRHQWITKAELGMAPTDLLYHAAQDTATGLLYLTNAGTGAVNGELVIWDGVARQVVARRPAGYFPGTVWFVR